jgi:hypothetical protein
MARHSENSAAPVMGTLLSDSSDQGAFTADYRNLRNKLIYQMNSLRSPGAKESSKMDFSHADAADARKLNRILWRDRKGSIPVPPIRHTAFQDLN